MRLTKGDTRFDLRSLVVRYDTLLHEPEIILSQESMESLQVCLWFHEVCGYLFGRRAYWQILLGFMLQRRKTPERDGFGAAWCCGACAARSHLKNLKELHELLRAGPLACATCIVRISSISSEGRNRSGLSKRYCRRQQAHTVVLYDIVNAHGKIAAIVA